MRCKYAWWIGCLSWLLWHGLLPAAPPAPTQQPLLCAIDLAIGEQQEVELSNGERARVRLVELEEQRDSVMSAVHEARVTVEVNGERAVIGAALYHLPVAVGGLQVDCPITKGPVANSHIDHWGLVKDARLRLWPASSPWITPGTMSYPVRQKWFATGTSMANEPVSPRPGGKLYYHSGLDIGGSEGLVEVTAATDGLIVSAGNHVLPELGDTPIEPRYDVVYILDHRGWYYRYSHLQMIAVDVIPGRKVQQGQLIGRLGKEGASGGWTHLHFEIKSRQPSGRWGTQEAYAFLWEAYIRQFSPERIAVARPGHHVLGGETVVLDGSKSWSAQGPIARYEWILADGRTATGAKVEQRYDRPGTYSEVLKIVDASGQAAFDFARVTVVNPVQPSVWPIRLHATYYPTFGLQAGDPVTFKVRAFGSTHGEEVWDLGDGSPPQTTRSDGNVQALAKDGYAVLTHRYRQAGDYLVLVQRQDRDGTRAMAHLHVHVE